MKVDVPADMKCKDKFLLQSTTINDAPADANLADLVLSPPTRLITVGTNRKRRHGGESIQRLDSTKENTMCMGTTRGF
jgi:hypothetical protein